MKKIPLFILLLFFVLLVFSSSSIFAYRHTSSSGKKKSSSSSSWLLFSTSSSNDDDEKPLPCKLNHGCVCNHSLPSVDISDGQTYGTCINCTDPRFTGWNCQSLRSTCVNNGQQPSPNAVCTCPPEFTGSYCEELQCVNAVMKNSSPARLKLI